MRVLGQILLWAGFISAALAATCQREADFLSEKERAALQRLPSKLNLNADELKSVTLKELKELTADEFSATVDAVIPISEANQKAIEETKAGATDAGATDAGATDAETGDEGTEDPTAMDADEIPAAPVTYAMFEKSRTTLLENKWSTVPWLWYGLSAIVGIFGVVILRSTAKSAEQEQGKISADFETVTVSLDKLIKGVNELHVNLDKKSPREIVQFIDDQLAETFSDFAEARNSLIQKFGLQPYAEIMTQFSSAERFINRSWSAAADGYLNEVRDCVDRSAAHLEETYALMSRYQSES